jgi:predicted cytidylate kinase
MVISFSGAPGSGKSTAAKTLAEKLGWPRYYIGGILRDIAAQTGMTLAEITKRGETDFSVDREIDEYQQDLGKTEDNFVIEGRTSWYFIPQSIKIYLDVELDEGVKRIHNELAKENNRNEGHGLKSVGDVKATVLKRIESDKKRYGQYYGFDVYDPKNYELCIDTTNLTREQTFAQIMEFVQEKMREQKCANKI